MDYHTDFTNPEGNFPCRTAIIQESSERSSLEFMLPMKTVCTAISVMTLLLEQDPMNNFLVALYSDEAHGTARNI